MRLASHVKTRRPKLQLQSLEGREVPASVVDVSVSASGVISIVGGDESDDISIKVEAGQVVVDPGADTAVSIDGGTPGAPGAIVNATGAGKSLKVDLKGGSDIFSIDGASPITLTGAADIKLGDGDNVLLLVTTAKIDLNTLSVSGGDGSDQTNISGGVGLGSKVSGNATFDYKVGTGVTSLADIDFLGNGGVKVKVAPKGGGAAVNLNNVDVTKTLDVQAGDLLFGGSFIANSALGGVKVKGVVAALGLNTTTVSGKVEVNSPSYVSQLQLQNSTVTGDVKVSSALVADLTTLGASATGNLTVAGKFASSLDSAGTSFKVNGNLSVTGKIQTEVAFDTTALSEVTGKATIKGGGLFAPVLVTNSFFKVGKDLSVDVLDSQNSGVTIGDGTAPVAIGGNLTIKGGAGTSFVALSAVTVAKNTSIKLGAGSDLVLLDQESVFSGKFDADLGAGDDTFAVGQTTGSTAAVIFAGKATVKMGTGNDELVLGILTGGDAFTKATFNGAGSKIDGGTGFNLFDNLPAVANFDGTGLPVASIVNFTDPV